MRGGSGGKADVESGAFVVGAAGDGGAESVAAVVAASEASAVTAAAPGDSAAGCGESAAFSDWIGSVDMESGCGPVAGESERAKSRYRKRSAAPRGACGEKRLLDDCPTVQAARRRGPAAYVKETRHSGLAATVDPSVKGDSASDPRSGLAASRRMAASIRASTESAWL